MAVSKQYAITVSIAVADVGGSDAAAIAAVAIATIAVTAVRDTRYDKSRK